MSKETLQYKAIFRAEPEGGYTVIIPALAGCVTYGKTRKEAKAMAQDAIKAYLASLERHGEPIPTDEDDFMTTIDVKVPMRKLAFA